MTKEIWTEVLGYKISSHGRWLPNGSTEPIHVNGVGGHNMSFLVAKGFHCNPNGHGDVSFEDGDCFNTRADNVKFRRAKAGVGITIFFKDGGKRQYSSYISAARHLELEYEDVVYAVKGRKTYLNRLKNHGIVDIKRGVCE